MSEPTENTDTGFGSSSKQLRLKFLSEFIVGCRILIEGGALRSNVHKMIRVALAYQWEGPLYTQYTDPAYYSLSALRSKPVSFKEKRRKLRRDHAIPLNMIIDRLLKPNAPVEWLLTRKLHARLITVEEDCRLTSLGLKGHMPLGWNWKSGPIDARYAAAGIKFGKLDRRT